jgi:hypothetical protein
VIRDFAERSEKIAALTERYRRGELGESTFTASLVIEGMRNDEIGVAVRQHQATHRQSRSYLRGDVT